MSINCKNCGNKNPPGSRGRKREFCCRQCITKYTWKNNRQKMEQSLLDGHKNNPHRAKDSSKRMTIKNPMMKRSIRELMSKTLKLIGHKPRTQGGNGRGPTVPQQMLFDSLGDGWEMEHVVKTKRKSPYPTCYKIDIANVDKMIGIEVDGPSHSSRKSRERDIKKTNLLTSLGWTIYRIKNEDILKNVKKCKNYILTSKRF